MKAFRDPVHNIIYFDKDREKLLIDLIDTEEFQRLRHINQLGVSSFTYPGATHTRYAHSLGVTYLMKRFIDKIMQLKDPLSEESKQDLKRYRMLALVSALLHDIGHGPFSHAIEGITGIDHEEVSIAIIGGDTKINELLESHQEGFAKEVIEVIRRTHHSLVVVKLLSSQLDVDRIDYLLRDSKMTGAGYGAFDLEWLINVLRIGEYRGAMEVGLDFEKGLSIAEDFVMARYYMYKHVYFHKATRSVEIMIKQILERVQQLNEVGKLEINEHVRLIFSKPEMPLQPNILHSFLQLTDHTIWHYIYEWRTNPDNTLSELCKHLLNRKLYKSINTPTDQMEFFKKVNEIAQREGKEIEDICHSDTPSTSYYKDNYISQHTKGEELEEEREASEQIILFNAEGDGFELSTKSSIIDHIRNKSIEVSRQYFPSKYKKLLSGG